LSTTTSDTDTTSTRSRGERARVVWTAAVTFAFTVTMFGTTLPTPLYGLSRLKFGFSELMITVIFATYAVGVLIALLLLGGLSDTVGRRRLLLPGLALSMLSAVVFLLAAGLPWLLAGRMLSGLSAGIFTGTATATIVDFAAPTQRERATMIATVANMGGLGLGPLISGIVSELGGPPLRTIFWLDLVLLVPATIGILAMPEPIAVRGRPHLRIQKPAVPPELRPIYLRAGLAGFAGFAVFGLFTSVAPAFLAEGLGVTSRAVVGAVVCSAFAASTVGQLSLRLMSDQVGLIAGCGALIAGMVLLATGLATSSLALLVSGCVVAGFGQGFTFRAGLTSLTTRTAAAQRGSVASSFFVVCYVAISIPVIAVGFMADTVGIRAAGITFAAIVAVLAVVVLTMLARMPVGAPATAR